MLNRFKNLTFISCVFAAFGFLAPAYSAQKATSDPYADTTVVLVHGAFADGSSWNKLIPLLQAKGLKVVAVQNPLTSLADDVAATQHVIDEQAGRVILVGHSWGGTVITQAGTSDKVKAMVYVAAYAPSAGQSTGDLGKDLPATPGYASLKPDDQGFVYLTPASMATNFAQDLPKKETQLMTATQQPIQVKAITDVLTAQAWKDKKTYYIVAARDRMISPELEHQFATKIKAETTELPTSHVPMLSQPQRVADVIMKAANAIDRR
ncbi:alpha/beta fold hydrolase [Pseudomonas gingeri]|uniref:alpha/beta fold hydrolase n=1 Tax=Pseudomonas gingeri TaxID=117681 RepID=UPI0015A20562|nr:alpha/beta hydrolase [Pseudomonas gingeri]NWD04149.1 alpha/beta hydrolase [Pseudomonas gingeri]NWE34219.1 alpha/beta hydrolase [Pseudomonas gingeri]NWE56529.1 alpha/beta hydrolase [Pseudomonas gingeri]NWF05745.1 alpha/beta hydrolase [Pseudomonas gingeri]